MMHYRSVVVGLGLTGFSCAKYLARKKCEFVVVDTRERPPYLDQLKAELPDVEIRLGPLDPDFLSRADELIVSPGISLREPAIVCARQLGVKIAGDIELFCREVLAPVIAVTGSNGKSTLTKLIGDIAEAAGVDVAIGGNIGIPVLDLLDKAPKALYVIEISSFQLETTSSLRAKAALLLNITPDHLDRYGDMSEYIQAKKRIFNHCEFSIYNLDDAKTLPEDEKITKRFYFTLGESAGDAHCFGVSRDENANEWLTFDRTLLMRVDELPQQSPYYRQNMLAAFAAAYAVGISFKYVRAVIRNFEGLPHRCQKVRECNGVTWFNDSKATNISSAAASVSGLGQQCPGRLILLAGGQGKGADFSELATVAKSFVDIVITYGEDGERIHDALTNYVSKAVKAADLKVATDLANELASPNDWVLLAPACASFDMFKNFEERGEHFVKYVKSLQLRDYR